MNIKTILLFLSFVLFNALQAVFSQSALQQPSNVQLPPYFQELKHGLPPEEMKYTEPKLYAHLFKRRAMLAGMLQKEVHDKKLPESALDILKPAEPVSYNKTAESTSINETAGSNIHLVKDINYATNSNPSNNLRGFRNTFAVLRKCVYYAADDGIHGTELWRSDGTEAGTYMVRDINDNDTSSSYPSYITQFQGKIYFRAYNPATGYEMYQSDGTAAGTILFKDINSGSASGYPGQFTIVKSKLYFVSDGASVLWKTDGTAEGTVVVKDLGDYWLSGISQLTAVNNLLFFSADSPDYSGEYEIHDRELWRSDGTSDGTIQLQYADDAEPANFTSFNNHLFFTENPTHLSGYTLWVSDGTVAGTNEIPNPNNVTVTSYHSYDSYDYQYQTIPLPVASNSLFFAGSTSATGNELYKYDTSKGIVLVKDITPGISGSDFSTESLRSMNNKIYFSLPDSTNKIFSFWKSGGYEDNTRSIKFLPGTINPYNFYASDSLLYFTLNVSNNNEPWFSDGTATGTKLLKDINPLGSSGSGYFTAADGKVFFSAYNDANGQELWMTNGTRQSTKLVKDMNISASGDGAFGYYSANMALNANTLIFPAYSPQYGNELWKTDGTEAGTVLIKDIDTGEHSSNPYLYQVKNGKAYFRAYDEASDADAIYVTDGTESGTKKITTADEADYIVYILAADNGNIFYTTETYLENYEAYEIQLWKTDSTGVKIKLPAGPLYFNVCNNICFFSSYASSAVGAEPYISDGTIAGTHILADLNPGTDGSFPYSFTQYKNKTLFGTNQGLYKTDGTSGGTVLLNNVIPFFDTATFQGKLYFEGERNYNYRPYSTNGTKAGTAIVPDIYADSSPLYPSNFAAADSLLYFVTNTSINDFKNDKQLWKVTGTTTPTASLIKDIGQSTSDKYVYSLVTIGNEAYFTYNNNFWKSDGTSQGTKKINNSILSGLSPIQFLTVVSNKLFFTGSNHAYGDEIYVMDNAKDKLNNTTISAAHVTKSSLSAQLATNPFNNDLKINITSLQKQQLTITVTNSSGQKIIGKVINVNAGVNTVSFNGSQWQSGLYIINISSGTETVSVKAIK